MFLAMTVLLLHPQLATTTSFSADKATMVSSAAAISVSTDSPDFETGMPVPTASLDAAAQPAAETSTALLEPPLPMPAAVAVSAPAPMAFLKPVKPMTVSIAELRAENRRKQLEWTGLAIAASGAATFDAWSTRRAITTSGAQELNPLLRPFAGNGSLYAAIQVGPMLMDFAAKKMMYSRRSWVRRMWWAPQSASFVSSILCGAHNLNFH
jgi:hypothetical protein